MSDSLHDTVRDRQLWNAVRILTVALVLLASYPSLPPRVLNWDNMVKLQVLGNLLAGAGPVVDRVTPDDGLYVSIGRDGRRYAGYPPFAYVLQWPVAAMHGLRGEPMDAPRGQTSEGLAPLPVLALVALVLVNWGRRHGATPTGAVAGALLTCFGTALWASVAHGYDVLIEVLALALMLWACSGEGSATDWILAGLISGVAVGARYGAVVLGVPAVVTLGLQEFRTPGRLIRCAGSFIVGTVPGVGTMLWFNWYRFGSPLLVQGMPVPYEAGQPVDDHFARTVRWFSRRHWQGMAGLTLSPGKGVFWYSPPMLGLVLQGRALWRRYPGIVLTLAVYVLAACLLLGRLAFWHGEWGWGPRYLAPSCVGVAPLTWWLWHRLATRGAAVRALAAAGFVGLIAVQALPVAFDPVGQHLATTIPRLAESGAMRSRPVTASPGPVDNVVLFYRPENSMIVSLVRGLPRFADRSPASVAAWRRFEWAMLVPFLATAFLVLLASAEVRRARGIDVARLNAVWNREPEPGATERR